MDLRVSFDYDGTLSRPDVHKFAEQLVQSGIEVWIVTTRYKQYDFINGRPLADNFDLLSVARACGINEKHIVFTSTKPKYQFFKDADFLWHLDNDEVEVREINEHTSVCAILLDKSWQSNVDSLMLSRT